MIDWMADKGHLLIENIKIELPSRIRTNKAWANDKFMLKDAFATLMILDSDNIGHMIGSQMGLICITIDPMFQA